MEIQEILNKKLNNRQELKKIIDWIDNDLIIVITGSRQVGKTSLIFLTIQELFNNFKINPGNIFYFDLEDFEILNLIDSGVKNFVKYILSRAAQKDNRIYIFIDEIQYLNNPSNFLKLIADHYKNLKVIATGSSTLEIKRKFKDSLVGRKIVINLNTLNFKEYLLFKERKELYNILNSHNFRLFIDSKSKSTNAISEEIPVIIKEEIKREFEEFITFGGYPAIVLENNYDKKKTLLNEIYTSYVRKDISALFSIESISKFNNLVKILSNQIGSLLNYNNLSNTLATTYITLEKYINILQSTFIIRLISPWYRNKNKEIIKMPKIYFYDTGLRNLIIRNFEQFEMRIDCGYIIENYFFCEIISILKDFEELKFWRTKSGSEVDFIIESESGTIPVEIKYQEIKKIIIPGGLASFISLYKPKKAFLITKNTMGKMQKENSIIFCIPVWLL